MAAERRYIFDIPAYYPIVSRHLYNLLDGLGVSKSRRKMKTAMYAQYEILSAVDDRIFKGRDMDRYVCGSQIECATTPGLHSDFDILLRFNCFNVIRDINEWRPGKKNLLICEEVNTHPGYVKLQRTYDDVPKPAYVYRQDPRLEVIDHKNRTMFPNSALRDSVDFSYVANGPAISVPVNASVQVTDNDIVACLPCHNFPTQAATWMEHQSKQGQISKEFMQKVVDYGCLVVPVGHAFSRENHLEWRLSFSLAERWMMMSLNMTQLKCYVLLKLIRKSFIKPKLGDNCLSSYHCKTCIFYMVQNTPKSMWCPDNLLLFLDMCLHTLYIWVDKGYCPQYFIPQNNLFDTKIHGEVRTLLRGLLQELLREKCRFFNRIQIDEIGSRLVKACTHTIPLQSITEYTKEAWVDIDADRMMLLKTTVFTCKELLHQTHKKTGGVTEAMISWLHQRLQQILTLCTISRIHKSILQSVCKFVKFTIGSHELAQMYTSSGRMPLPIVNFTVLDNLSTDASSSYIKLASMLYSQGQYLNARKVLEVTANACKHYIEVICFCYEHQRRYVGMSFTEKILSEDRSTPERMIQKYAAFCVMFLPTEAVHAPRALQYEMFRSVATRSESRNDIDGNENWYDWMVIDSITYMYYLQYSCYHALRQVSQRSVALDNLVWVIRQTYNILGHRETALNLLGDCYMKRGWIRLAYRAWSTSMNVYRGTKIQQHNAAKWHLALLFRKIDLLRRLYIALQNFLTPKREKGVPNNRKQQIKFAANK